MPSQSVEPLFQELNKVIGGLGAGKVPDDTPKLTMHILTLLPYHSESVAYAAVADMLKFVPIAEDLYPGDNLPSALLTVFNGIRRRVELGLDNSFDIHQPIDRGIGDVERAVRRLKAVHEGRDALMDLIAVSSEDADLDLTTLCEEKVRLIRSHLANSDIQQDDFDLIAPALLYARHLSFQLVDGDERWETAFEIQEVLRRAATTAATLCNDVQVRWLDTNPHRYQELRDRMRELA